MNHYKATVYNYDQSSRAWDDVSDCAIYEILEWDAPCLSRRAIKTVELSARFNTAFTPDSLTVIIQRGEHHDLVACLGVIPFYRDYEVWTYAAGKIDQRAIRKIPRDNI